MKRFFLFLTIACFVLSLTACDELDAFLADLQLAVADDATGSAFGSSGSGSGRVTVESIGDVEWNPAHEMQYDFFTRSYVDYWHERSHAYRFKGDGTAGNPILIRNIDEFVLLDYIFHSSTDDCFIYSENPMPATPDEYYIKLMTDINLADYGINWIVPLTAESDDRPFNGVFDGNGKTIRYGNAYAPFFDTVGTFGIVKNLNIVGDVKFDPDLYDAASPFCRILDGTLMNCTYTGSLSNIRKIYDIACSESGLGYTVGCVSVNTGRSDGLVRNVKDFGSTGGSEADDVSYLNGRIATWNALYGDYEGYRADFHLARNADGNVKAVNDAPAPVALPEGNAPDGFRFSNIFHADMVLVNSYPSPSECYVWGINYPVVDYRDPVTGNRTKIRLWGKGTSIVVEPLGQKVKYFGEYRDSYRAVAYIRQDDGSYLEHELQKKDVFLFDSYEDGKQKAITLRVNMYEIRLATKEYLSGQKFYTRNLNQYQTITFTGIVRKDIIKSYPSEAEYRKLISSGNW